MNDHYVITADRGHLRIFKHREEPGQSTAALDEVQGADFPAGLKSYTDSDTDMAGRFQGSKQQGRGPGTPAARTGMSIDERLPMQREEDRREVRDVAGAIDSFLKSRPDATWDFAAGPAIHHAVLESLSTQARNRLRQSLIKDLVNQPPAELQAHFSEH